MNDTPFISVVIPTYNRSASLQQGLAVALNQHYPADRYEVIVVDDASTDNTAALLEEWSQLYPHSLRIFTQEKNRGPAAARNRGIAASKGSLIAFTDDDCVVTPEWLVEIQSGYRDPETAGVGGRVRPLTVGSAIQRYYAHFSPISQPPIEAGAVRRIITANASFRRDVLLEVNGFDERVRFAGGEDPDLCFRIRSRGYRFHYNPGALVYHQYDSSWRSFVWTYYRYGLGAAFFSLQHTQKVQAESHGWLLGRLGWLLGMLAIPYRLWHNCQHGVRGADVVTFSVLDGLYALSFMVGMMRGYIAHLCGLRSASKGVAA